MRHFGSGSHFFCTLLDPLYDNRFLFIIPNCKVPLADSKIWWCVLLVEECPQALPAYLQLFLGSDQFVEAWSLSKLVDPMKEYPRNCMWLIYSLIQWEKSRERYHNENFPLMANFITTYKSSVHKHWYFTSILNVHMR